MSLEKNTCANPNTWTVESKDGRFVIDYLDDGVLMLADFAMMNPDDEDDTDGMFSIEPEEVEEYISLMRKAVEAYDSQKSNSIEKKENNAR